MADYGCRTTAALRGPLAHAPPKWVRPADKNMRHSIIAGVRPDSGGTGRTLSLIGRAPLRAPGQRDGAALHPRAAPAAASVRQRLRRPNSRLRPHILGLEGFPLGAGARARVDLGEQPDAH